MSGAAKAAIAVIIIVIVVVGALAAGLIPGVHLLSTSTGGTTTVSSTTAAGNAAGAAKTHHAGALVVMVGVSTTYGFSFNSSELGSSSCPVSDALTSNLSVPAEGGSYSSGNAALWLFIYVNATAVSESAIAVVGSTTYFLGTVSGSPCVTVSTLENITGTYESSTTVAATVNSDAGSFLSAHSSANSVFALIENGTAGPEWVVAYTNCSYDPSTGKSTGGPKGDLFLAAVNGTSGSVVESENLAGKANCSGLSSITTPSYALGMELVSATGAGSLYYATLALTPTAGLTTAMFGFDITNATGAFLPLSSSVPAGCKYGASISSCTNSTTGGWYVVLLGAAGKVVATWSGAGWTNLAPSTTNLTLTAADTAVVVTGTIYDGQGYSLNVFSTGSDEVSGSVVL